MDCLVHRRQEWRIGDVNTGIVGPRDQWRQYSWGNAERKCVFTDAGAPLIEPVATPSIREIIRAKSSKGKLLEIEREAKFLNVRSSTQCCYDHVCVSRSENSYILQVASGKYHTLLLSGSFTYHLSLTVRVHSTSLNSHNSYNGLH